MEREGCLFHLLGLKGPLDHCIGRLGLGNDHGSRHLSIGGGRGERQVSIYRKECLGLGYPFHVRTGL